MIAAFADGAGRAKVAGFDGVQMQHGYLLSQFLSPVFNLIKLNCSDFVDNGLTLEDSLQVGRMLAGIGLDAIELSGGLLKNSKLSPSRFGVKTEEDEAYFREEARHFKNATGIPLILVGGMRSFSVAERLVEDGVGLHLHEPPVDQRT